ncbi:hypothetical protein BDF20DRAFT_848273 [Mycotypha africana]|uniref:uncharacterized protein n=1 Tax=Mycotypha africana TaxID=64632 RepID=UPI00230098AC|nr:uncharacterized protein BDF20DRAFT_848273 [Mycotypha africana]KAI8992100.1 hypothetical protein BDF20DRAFT_848273 [Mycotypha africana]
MSSDDDTNSRSEVIPLKQHKIPLELRTDPIKGRGVFATEPIEKNTLVEISPILFFKSDEYKQHGQYTILDHYTYCWKEGGYALALGLGSMFNHHSNPNMGFIRDVPNQLIRYVTLRRIERDEELCISYGNHLWFEDSTAADTAKSESEDEPFPFGSTSIEDEE